VFKTVVGIVGEVKQGELSETETPTVYEYTRERDMRSLFVAIRTSVPPLSLAQPVAAVVRGMDKEQPVENVRTMETALSETLSSQRLSATLLGLFASVALALASIGIYSVLSYIVRGRRREIGIRTALGAQTGDVLRLVVLEGMKPAIWGIVAGAVAALASARVLETLVFEVSPSDPLTLVAVVGSLAIVSLVASLVPAYRASRADSLTVLREN
jgi:putative ABC transport system permease protein